MAEGESPREAQKPNKPEAKLAWAMGRVFGGQKGPETGGWALLINALGMEIMPLEKLEKASKNFFR